MAVKAESEKLMRDYEKKVRELKISIVAKIMSLPDNPKIKRIGGGKAFTIGVKDLGDGCILSPFYHDFKAQYRELVKIINTKPVEVVISDFENIIDLGYAGKRAGDSAKRFHPTVRKYLKELM